MSKTSASSSSPSPQLRPPFKLVVKVASSVSSAVNGTIDGTVGIVGKSASAFLKNSYVEKAKNGILAFEANVQGKVKPYTAKTQPYVQPLVPYINKASPYIPPVILAVLALASIPVFFIASIIAIFTAPIWLTVGFFTAFIWIPIAIFSFIGAAALAFVAAVRYLSQPAGQAILNRWWSAITATPSGRRIFYVAAKPAVAAQPALK